MKPIPPERREAIGVRVREWACGGGVVLFGRGEVLSLPCGIDGAGDGVLLAWVAAGVGTDAPSGGAVPCIPWGSGSVPDHEAGTTNAQTSREMTEPMTKTTDLARGTQTIGQTFSEEHVPTKGQTSCGSSALADERQMARPLARPLVGRPNERLQRRIRTEGQTFCQM